MKVKENQKLKIKGSKLVWNVEYQRNDYVLLVTATSNYKKRGYKLELTRHHEKYITLNEIKELIK